MLREVACPLGTVQHVTEIDRKVEREAKACGVRGLKGVHGKLIRELVRIERGDSIFFFEISTA